MRRVRFTLPLHDQPTARGRDNANPPAEEQGTVFPSDASEGFFARPGSYSTDNGHPHVWTSDYAKGQGEPCGDQQIGSSSGISNCSKLSSTLRLLI